MKKFILTLFIVSITLLSSCSNDSIKITDLSKDINFEIEPFNVVKDFVNEFEDAGLDKVSSGFIRVRLLVYNEQGDLKSSNEHYINDYSERVSTKINLSSGSYTAVVITDFVRKDKSDYNWSLSYENHLSDTRITSNGYIGGKYAILGIGAKTFAVSYNSIDDISIEPKPAGALICTLWYNVHERDWLDRVDLEKNKTGLSLELTSHGDYLPSFDSNDEFKWRTNTIVPKEVGKEYDGVYGFSFELPVRSIKYRFAYYSPKYNNGHIYWSTMNCDLIAGDIYQFWIDLSNASYGFEHINSTKSPAKSIINHNGNAIMISDIINK